MNLFEYVSRVCKSSLDSAIDYRNSGCEIAKQDAVSGRLELQLRLEALGFREAILRARSNCKMIPKVGDVECRSFVDLFFWAIEQAMIGGDDDTCAKVRCSRCYDGLDEELFQAAVAAKLEGLSLNTQAILRQMKGRTEYLPTTKEQVLSSLFMKTNNLHAFDQGIELGLIKAVRYVGIWLTPEGERVASLI